MSDCVSCDG